LGAFLPTFDYADALRQVAKLPDALVIAASKAGHRAPLTIQASILSALEAWQHAQLVERDTAALRIGLDVAGHNTTRSYQERIMREGLDYLPPSYALRFLDTDQVGTLSEIFNIKEEGFLVGGASASGNVALIQAARMIQFGLLDVCMVVGVMADLSSFELQGFHNIGALGSQRFQSDPQQACRPFDQERDGFIVGQGSGCIILESHAAATAATVPILAEIKGSGMSLDANRYAYPSRDGEMRAMQKALHQAECPIEEIDYVNAHATSSVIGDQTEIDAIECVFNQHCADLVVNATKGFLGHCLYAAGILEVIAMVVQMQNSFLHANLNLASPLDTQCCLPQSTLQQSVTFGMSNSFGFGGMNTSIILQSGR